MPRLSIEIDKELDSRLDKFLPWGTKQNVCRLCLEMLCDAVEQNGKQIIGLMLNKEYNPITKEVKTDATS